MSGPVNMYCGSPLLRYKQESIKNAILAIKHRNDPYIRRSSSINRQCLVHSQRSHLILDDDCENGLPGMLMGDRQFISSQTDISS